MSALCRCYCTNDFDQSFCVLKNIVSLFSPLSSDFPWELDPDIYGDRHYNVFTREFYPSLEDIVGSDVSGVTDEDLDSAVLFGTLRGNVVGLRYYSGVVSIRRIRNGEAKD